MDARGRWRLIRIFAAFLFLSVAWFAFSASFAPFSLAVGLFGSFAIAFEVYDVFIEEHEAARRSFLPRLFPALVFPFLVAAAMYAAAFRVARSVITGKVAPRVVHFRSRLRSDLARVVLAESITFTPGTIVLELDEDHYVVHWLNATTRHSTRSGAEIKGNLEDAVRRIWA